MKTFRTRNHKATIENITGQFIETHYWRGHEDEAWEQTTQRVHNAPIDPKKVEAEIQKDQREWDMDI